MTGANIADFAAELGTERIKKLFSKILITYDSGFDILELKHENAKVRARVKLHKQGTEVTIDL